MWDIAVSHALAKETVNPELTTETVSVDELFKVIVGSYDNDTKTTNFHSSETTLGCGGIENPFKISPSFIISFLHKTNLSDTYLLNYKNKSEAIIFTT